MPEPPESSEARLDSWKEIAEYLGRNTTTARRWEREEGLPVHRHSHNSRSSVYAFPREIDAWKASRKTVPAPAPVNTLWRIPTFALAILLCLLMVGNGIRPASAARARQGATEGISLRQVCAGCDGAVSPDGRYVADTSHAPDLSVLDLSSGQSHPVAHLPRGTRAINPIWSPDSKRIAYYTSNPDAPYTPMANRQTIVVNRDGSGSRTIYREGSAYGWSGDGKRVLVASQARPEDPVKLAWISLVDGARQPLPTALMSLDAASVSPDGRYIAFNATTNASAETNVHLMASDGSGENVIAPNSAYQSPVGWSPDGKHLLYSQYGNSVTLWSVPVANGRAQGSPMAVKDFGNEPRFSDLGVTNGGTLFYRIVTSTSTVYTASMDPATGRATSSPQLVPTTLATKSVLPRWSPDSAKILYGGARPGPAANSELHVFSFGTGKDQRVAESVAVGGDGYCWTHDGNSILLNTNVAAPGAPLRNEAVRADLSTGAAKPVLPGVNFRMRSCSEPLIAARTGRSVVTRNIETGVQKELYQLDATASPNHGIPVISHNGNSVAFLIPIDAQTTALVTVPTGGGSPREIARAKAPAELQFFYGFCWSPDDRYVYFLKRADSHSPHELFRVAAAGGAEESMGLKAMDIRDLDIAPDGRRIAFSIGAAQRPEIWAMENFLPGK